LSLFAFQLFQQRRQTRETHTRSADGQRSVDVLFARQIQINVDLTRLVGDFRDGSTDGIQRRITE
jgi:hypothetical protein